LISNSNTIIDQLTDIKLKQQRREIDLETLTFNKVISYERFLDFLHLSKYDNEFLVNLDTEWKYDEEEKKRLAENLKNKGF
jgi:hypothetical protein